jgi:hypothetical protein
LRHGAFTAKAQDKKKEYVNSQGSDYYVHVYLQPVRFLLWKNELGKTNGVSTLQLESSGMGARLASDHVKIGGKGAVSSCLENIRDSILLFYLTVGCGRNSINFYSLQVPLVDQNPDFSLCRSANIGMDSDFEFMLKPFKSRVLDRYCVLLVKCV